MNIKRVVLAIICFFIMTSLAFSDQPEENKMTLPRIPIYTFFFNIIFEPFPFPVIGFINNAIGNHVGLQTGFVNINTKNFYGLQAGYVNTAGGSLRGLQSGFVNVTAGNFSGFQGGFVNVTAENFLGLQAGFFNVSRNNLIGVQLGCINITGKETKGVQIGLLNITEDLEGITIGLLTIVKNGGYHAFEYYFSEFFTYNVAFRTGKKSFYNSFIASYNQTSDFSFDNFAFGYGIGTFISINEVLYINPELNNISINQLFKASIDYYSLIVYLGVNLGKFSIAAGPSATFAHTFSKDAKISRPLYSIYSYDFDDKNIFVIGARISARLSI